MKYCMMDHVPCLLVLLDYENLNLYIYIDCKPIMFHHLNSNNYLYKAQTATPPKPIVPKKKRSYNKKKKQDKTIANSTQHTNQASTTYTRSASSGNQGNEFQECIPGLSAQPVCIISFWGEVSFLKRYLWESEQKSKIVEIW